MIGIIDYGLGNIKAFCNVYKDLGVDLKIIDDQKKFSKDIKKIILPGVGSFDEAIKKLKKKNFFNEIKNFCSNQENKILGVCIGMQILGKNSEEGEEQGLNLINGNILKFKKIRSPHMGWNNIEVVKKDLILKDISNDEYFYFLHSYYFQEEFKENVFGISKYEKDFTSIIKKNNIYGVQFHPEKSHKSGLIFLKNFNEI